MLQWCPGWNRGIGKGRGLLFSNHCWGYSLSLMLKLHLRNNSWWTEFDCIMSLCFFFLFNSSYVPDFAQGDIMSGYSLSVRLHFFLFKMFCSVLKCPWFVLLLKISAKAVIDLLEFGSILCGCFCIAELWGHGSCQCEQTWQCPDHWEVSVDLKR